MRPARRLEVSRADVRPAVATALARRAGLAWPLPAAAELATIDAGYAVYSLVRLALRAGRKAAFAHAAELWQSERLLHLNAEPYLNHPAATHLVFAETAGYYYGLAHFLVTPLVLAWLYPRRPAAFPRLRSAPGAGHRRCERGVLGLAGGLAVTGLGMLATSEPGQRLASRLARPARLAHRYARAPALQPGTAGGPWMAVDGLSAAATIGLYTTAWRPVGSPARPWDTPAGLRCSPARECWPPVSGWPGSRSPGGACCSPTPPGSAAWKAQWSARSPPPAPRQRGGSRGHRLPGGRVLGRRRHRDRGGSRPRPPLPGRPGPGRVPAASGQADAVTVPDQPVHRPGGTVVPRAATEDSTPEPTIE